MNRAFRLSVALGSALVVVAWGGVLQRLTSAPVVARTMAPCECNSNCMIDDSGHDGGSGWDSPWIGYIFDCTVNNWDSAGDGCKFEIDCDLYELVNGSYVWYDSKSTGTDNPIHMDCVWLGPDMLYHPTDPLHGTQTFTWNNLPAGQYQAVFSIFVTNPDGTWDFVSACDGALVYFTSGITE